MLAGAAGIYAATEAAASIGSLPGARRRFTGSYDAGAFDPGRLPATSWLFDEAPTTEREAWRLTIHAQSGSTARTPAKLAGFDDRLGATLDCTGGFYSLQDWSGVRLDRLIRNPGDTLSFEVRSATGMPAIAWSRLSSVTAPAQPREPWGHDSERMASGLPIRRADHSSAVSNAQQLAIVRPSVTTKTKPRT